MVDDSKEKDKGKKTLKRGLTLIVKKLKSIESTFRETSRPNHKQERWPLYQSKRQQLAESNPDTQKEIFADADGSWQRAKFYFHYCKQSICECWKILGIYMEKAL